MLCILLMLLSSMDVALAKGKKKKAKKIQRTEAVYEEIDNFDFLYADDYNVNMSFASTDDILRQATSFIGTRYRLGSKGPNAFDCSGFTSYVYGQNNIAIGGSSRDQYARNIPNTFTFIHASTKNGVKISSSTDGNYSRRYIGVRRVAR